MNYNMCEIMAWVSTGIAVSVGIIVTGNPLCLSALLVPAMVYGS